MKRSDGHSAVAAAAYISGTKLFNEYDHRTRDYSNKKGVIHSEILLPQNAPSEFSDRATLWNSVEREEKQHNSQLARRIIVALPKELSHEDNIKLLKQYCQEQFVSKGMCCDLAFHDEGNGNPHAHILLTMRAIGENGKWLPKSHKVYDLDEHGERIKLPSGNWKSHKENTVDWNDKRYAEIWRNEWETLQNQYLSNAQRPERVSLQSYEKQGVEQIPTIHMGAALTNMERKGVQTEIGNINRQIMELNRLSQSVKQLVMNALKWIEKFRNVLSESGKKEKSLAEYLYDYIEIRRLGREEWHCAKTKKLSFYAKDVNKVTEAQQYLKECDLFTLVDLENKLKSVQAKHKKLRSDKQTHEKRDQEISAILDNRKTRDRYKSVFDAYSKIFFKTFREKFYAEHKTEIDAYRKALRALQNHPQDEQISSAALKKEQAAIPSKIDKISDDLKKERSDLKLLKDVRYWVQQTMSLEDYERLSDPNWKPSINKRLNKRQQADMAEKRERTEQHHRTTKRKQQEL